MKIHAIASTAQMQNNNTKKQQQNPNFKSGGFLGFAAGVMQGIESKGYLASFLIQDILGMTAPRVWTGFNRDKDITGEYNLQEGFEVLGREGMTGPFMMAVAPAILFLTTRFCRSTNSSTNLIKRYGKTLQEFLKQSNVDNALKQDSKKFKAEYIKFNIEKMYKASVPNDKDAVKTIENILKEFEKLEGKDKKVRKEGLNKIVEIINEKMLETSPEYYHLNKIAVGEGASQKFFNAKDALLGLEDFCQDAIINNSFAKEIDEKAAENIANNFATKRLLTNVANVAVTLGGLSVLPKIYARNDVAPSAQTLQHIQNQSATSVVEEDAGKEDKKAEVTFKGKGINSENLLSKIGKFLTNKVPEKFYELFEYSGYNFSKSMFAALSVFGLLAPRGKRAWDRAQKDENGKRDLTELNEILLRDTVSSLSVVFAVPILTKVFVNNYENKKGFILTNRASEGAKPFKKFLDVINPYSNLEVLSIADLDAIYGNINSKDKLMNFAKFVDKNGGDLEKILSKSENVKEMFNEKSFTLDSIKSLAKKDKNKKIIELFEKFEVADSKAVNETISKLMKGSGDIKNNKIASMARGLNSVPGLISTFIISPVLLGVLIPKLTYFNTKKAHMKMAQEREQKELAKA